MSEPFINKVAESGLISIDLSSFLPNNEIVVFDLKPFLFKELILKEKEFRTALGELDWTQYQDKIVGIHCSNDAIIPMWANMLVASNLTHIASAVYYGDEKKVRDQILLQGINSINVSSYTDQRVVVKGCGDMPTGESAYIAITQKLKPVVKSIMFGEPCSTVPVYKRK